MTASTMDSISLKEEVAKMTRAGMTITSISKELGISWNEARSLAPTTSWRGAKVRITNRLKRLQNEKDQSRREKLANEADRYVDFLYDSAVHLRSQVDSARRALDR